MESRCTPTAFCPLCRRGIRRLNAVISAFRWACKLLGSHIFIILLNFQILQEMYKCLGASSQFGTLLGLKTDANKEMTGFLDSKSKYNCSSVDSGNFNNVMDAVEDSNRIKKALKVSRASATSLRSQYSSLETNRHWDQFVEIVHKKMRDRQVIEKRTQRKELIRNVSEHVEASMKKTKLIQDVFLSGSGDFSIIERRIRCSYMQAPETRFLCPLPTRKVSNY
jgi:protoheme ferro-lyase